MRPKYLQELIKNLQEFYRCPSCNTNYHFDDIRFLGEVERYCFVQLSCHECSLPVLATVSSDDNKVGSKGRSDLGRGEASKFAGKGAISASEIAEFHRVITTSKMVFKGRS
jgi:hypothetical protein